MHNNLLKKTALGITKVGIFLTIFFVIFTFMAYKGVAFASEKELSDNSTVKNSANYTLLAEGIHKVTFDKNSSFIDIEKYEPQNWGTVVVEHNKSIEKDDLNKGIRPTETEVGDTMPWDPPSILMSKLLGRAYFVYRFMGWNTKPDGSGEEFTQYTIVTEDMTVYGTWMKDIMAYDGIVPDFKYAYYRFESVTLGKQLPEEVNKLLPVDNHWYRKGDIAKAKPVYEDKVESDDGIWSFLGYTFNSIVFDETDVTFVGQWKYKANEYSVSYEFKSGTPGKSLPDSVNTLLPKDMNKYVTTDRVQAIHPMETKIEDPVLDGVWTFQGYDEETKIINKANVSFIGEWTFEKRTASTTEESTTQETTEEVSQETTVNNAPKDEELPNTGTASSLIGVGSALMLSGMAIVRLKKKE